MGGKGAAESELYEVVRGAGEGLGIKTLCIDMGSDVGTILELDATAAKGILDRQGIAKVRHIDVNCLWLQEQCLKQIIPLENPWRGQQCRSHDQASVDQHDLEAHF